MSAAADLFQLAGEVAFDGNRYALAAGHSYRRRGAVLTDLAVIGVRRGEVEQVVAYGGEAVGLARATGSGYVVRRLQALRGELGSLGKDRQVVELGAEIAVLGMS